jgi:hypothetical protein
MGKKRKSTRVVIKLRTNRACFWSRDISVNIITGEMKFVSQQKQRIFASPLHPEEL